MSLINKKNFILDDDEQENANTFKMPNIVTSKPEVFPIKKALAISFIIHPLTVFFIWLITVMLALMGINLSLFQKPNVQLKKDIEFVLVEKEGTPRNPNTKNRADINSRSGGVNDPKRKVSLPSAPSSKSKKPAAKPAISKNVSQQKTVAKQPIKNAQKKPAVVQKSNNQINKPSPARPAPPTARPSSRPVTTPVPVQSPSSAFNVPAPKAAPVGKTLATGPVGGNSAPVGSKTGSYGTGSSGHSSYAPRPSLSPSVGGGGNGQLSRGYGGNGNIGNPGGGGGAPGIDALREPDFGPYMRELQMRIKLNWDPPKGNESKRVVLLFKIAKDGRLLSCRIQKSSGMPIADQAALKAVELTAPFRPLPGDFKGQSIDIQFTFDYNVFNASRY